MRIEDMSAGNRALTVRDCSNVLRDFGNGTWVKCCLDDDRAGMYVLHCVDSDVECLFGLCYDEAEYEKNVFTIMQGFQGHQISELGSSIFMLLHTFIHL